MLGRLQCIFTSEMLLDLQLRQLGVVIHIIVVHTNTRFFFFFFFLQREEAIVNMNKVTWRFTFECDAYEETNI